MTIEDRRKIEGVIKRLQMLLEQDPDTVSHVTADEYMTGPATHNYYLTHELPKDTPTCKVSVRWREPDERIEDRMAVIRGSGDSESIKDYDNIVRIHKCLLEVIGGEQGQEG